jgi:hypothetical protein
MGHKMENIEILRVISESDMLKIRSCDDFSTRQLPSTNIMANLQSDPKQSDDLFIKKIMSRLPR